MHKSRVPPKDPKERLDWSQVLTEPAKSPFTWSLPCLLASPPHSLPSRRFKLRVAEDIAKGMLYMHSFYPPIVHRDLRSPNVFIYTFTPSEPNVAKVADFGLAIQVRPMKGIIEKKKKDDEGLRRGQAAPTVAGQLRTWRWTAPESLKQEIQEYNEKVTSFLLSLSESLGIRQPALVGHCTQ